MGAQGRLLQRRRRALRVRRPFAWKYIESIEARGRAGQGRAAQSRTHGCMFQCAGCSLVAAEGSNAASCPHSAPSPVHHSPLRTARRSPSWLQSCSRGPSTTVSSLSPSPASVAIHCCSITARLTFLPAQLSACAIFAVAFFHAQSNHSPLATTITQSGHGPLTHSSRHLRPLTCGLTTPTHPVLLPDHSASSRPVSPR
jgi:hypothetical protein